MEEANKWPSLRNIHPRDASTLFPRPVTATRCTHSRTNVETRFKLALERELANRSTFVYEYGLFSSSPLGRSEETSVVQKTAPSASSSLALLFHSRFSFESAFDPPRNPIDLQFRFLFLPFHLSFFFSFSYPRIWIINSRENRGARRYLGGRRKNLRTDLRGRSERGRVSGGRIERRMFLRSKTSMRREQENTSRPPRVVVAFSVKLLR